MAEINPATLLDKFKDIPAMPNVVMQALQIIQDPDSGASDLAKVISYDQALSTKVLTIVNSAYYGFAQQITSIARAISLIGMAKTKNIVMTIAMKQMLTSQGDKLLWMQSLTTAVGCEYLAKYLKVVDVDEAFVIGFLHDLGKILLRTHDPKAYEQVKLAVNHGFNILNAERKYYGCDHSIIGSLLAKRWQLPLIIVNTMKYHHIPSSSSMPAACALVNIVDTMVKDDFKPEYLNQQAAALIHFNVQNYDVIRKNIFAKASLLIKEFSN